MIARHKRESWASLRLQRTELRSDGQAQAAQLPGMAISNPI